MKKSPAIVALSTGLCCLLPAKETASGDPRYFTAPSAGEAPLPFSEAVQVGNMLYVSGQIGNMPGTLDLVRGGIEPEARRALENMKLILERRGGSMDKVVKCTIFLADIGDWPAFNAVYRGFFKTNLPARSAMAASGLALGARVEVECIAFVPPRKQ